MIHTTPLVHLRLGVPLEHKTERLVLRAVLTASRLLGVATGTHLRHLRDTEDPLPTLHARLQEAELRAHLAWEAANILRSESGGGSEVRAVPLGDLGEPPLPSPEAPEPRRTTHPVIARFVHHTWMMDISLVKQFLGPTSQMATVFDAFSRVVSSASARRLTPGGASGPTSNSHCRPTPPTTQAAIY